MDIKTYTDLFKLQIPIAVNGVFWNGKPSKWSNLKEHNLKMSQRFAMNMLNYGQFGMKGHNGVDIAGSKNPPIVAPIKMWISYIQIDPKGYGNAVWAETETIKLNGEYYKLQFVFGHFKNRTIKVERGHWIDKAEFLGIMGSTGWSTGTHVHFGVRPFHSLDGNNWELAFPDNGYKGYVDPELFMPELIWDYQKLINKDKFMAKYEKKIIIEGEGAGRKGIIVNGKLREIKEGREASACLYALANNNLGKTVSSKAFDDIEKDKDF